MSQELTQVPNLAHACLTVHCQEGRGDRRTYRWITGSLEKQDYTFNMLERESNRVANVFKQLGIRAGDTVSIFLPRLPELFSALFGVLKNEALFCILFSTFGENALLDRLDDNGSKIVVTKKSLLRKILNVQPELANLKYILVIDIEEHISEQVLSLPKMMAAASDGFDYSPTLAAGTPAFLQYTSGSTGKPKGALHVHDGLTAMVQSFQEVMEPAPGEMYWCTADPAWITGLVYGVFAPYYTLTDQLQFGGAYHAERWLELLQDEKIQVWYTAPTALRMLMQEEEALFQRFDFSALRRVYCVGEPLNPEIFYWGQRVFAQDIKDTFFQSETGSMMVTNRSGFPIRPGSMGKPLSYIDAAILDKNGKPVNHGNQGLLSFKANWSSMFRAYLNKEALYKEKFIGDYYITGDLAWQDPDGYIWYVGRADDVINTAGHLVGPFEVESALLEVEEIADVAVIGVPDALLHEKIIAFVCPRKDLAWSRELELKCRINVSNRVSTVAIPQEFHVVEKIPKNKSGKILRRVLKAWYEGTDPGDLSTMED